MRSTNGSLLTSPLSELKELQDNEVEALKGMNSHSIFMDDYEPVVTKNAWKITPTEHEFKLRLRPNEDDLKKTVSVELHVKFPKTYPRVAPDIRLLNPRGLSNTQRTDLQKNLSALIKENLGQEMVFTIAQFAQEYITANNNIVRGVGAMSFHEQMLSRIEQTTKAEQQKALELQKHLEEVQNMEREKLIAKIQEDMEQKAKAKEAKRKLQMLQNQHDTDGVEVETAFPTVSFDSFIPLEIDNQESPKFKSVILGPLIGKGPIGYTHIVHPADLQLKGEWKGPVFSKCFALKEVDISGSHYLELDGKKKLEEIEKELERLKSLRHPNLISIYEGKLERRDSGWYLHVLMEHASGGTLLDLLRKCGTIRLEMAREYMKQLLSALDYVHSHNLVHKDIKASNTLFQVVESDECKAKLSDVSYHRKLLDMHKSHPLSEYSAEERRPRWRSPEHETRPNLYSRKNDIWYLGIIFVQMLCGCKVVDEYESIDDLLESRDHDLPEPVVTVLRRMFESDYRKRPTALELLHDHFFNDDPMANPLPLSFLISSNANTTTTLVSPQETTLLGKSPGYFSSSPPHSQTQCTTSRYKSDFEEITFLGRGGFGEVVKARNKLDGRFYAIKKVRLNPNDFENTRKILREVTTLSRLHHQFVVRYYTTWFEDSDGLYEHTSFDSSDSSSLSSTRSATDTTSSSDLMPPTNNFDFLSTSKSNSRKSYNMIRFGYSSEEDEDDDFESGIKSGKDENGAADKNNNNHNRNNGNNGNNGKSTNDKKTSKEKTRILYIQMEYCEKKTLHDVIEEGISEEEGWRLFRQIVEGLVHIHGQGMIHRDLKPSNIFLDANGDVKIGDFGLATTNAPLIDITAPQVQNYQSYEYAPAQDESLTAGVGTALYVSPEIAANSHNLSRYNAKVDIYSLGIIFFEICYNFSTEMERRTTIMDLRRTEIVFPKEFPCEKLKNQEAIIRWCLQHNPKDRPTSMELLRCEYMPPKMEDEYIQESVRTIANPNNPYYQKLMAALFTQQSDKHKDYTYDYNSGHSDFAAYNEITYSKVRDHMVKIFRRHGAIELNAPLLMPKTDLYKEDREAVYLLDAEGAIIQLPFDLTVPFARYIGRHNITDIKRYVFGKVYRTNPVGGQPRVFAEVDFDIVHSTNTCSMIPEAEVLKVVDEIIEEFPLSNAGDYCFYVTHANIIDAIFDCCRVPCDIRRGVCSVLSKLGKVSTGQIRKQLMVEYQLPRSICDELELFDFRGELETVYKKLEKLVPVEPMRTRIKDAVRELKTLSAYLKDLGVHRQLVFVPLLIHNHHYYKNGIIFQVLQDNNRKDESILAAGGRYDSLIQQFRYPIGFAGGLTGRKQIFAVGVNIAVQKIINACVHHQACFTKNSAGRNLDEEKSYGIWMPKKCDIYVASLGKVQLAERLEVVRELWSHNIRADFMYEDGTYLTPEMLIHNCRHQGINWIAILRHKSQDHYNKSGNSRDSGISVKVKNVLRKTEVEVPRSELCMYLSSEIQDQMRIDQVSGARMHRHHSISQSDQLLSSDFIPANQSTSTESSAHHSNLPVTIVSLQSNKKMKHKQKQLLIDKAHLNINTIIDDIKSGNVPIMALDINKELLKKLSNCYVLEDDSFKKVLDAVPANYREYMIQIRDVLKKHHKHGHKHVWLYSHKDDYGLLYQFES